MILAHAWPPRLPERARQRVQDALNTGCSSWQCSSPSAALVQRTIAGGTVTVRLQCTTCGHGLGGPLKRDDHPQWRSYPVWNDALVQDQVDQLNRDREAARAEHAKLLEQIEIHNLEWWDGYNAYLRSPVWRTKRARVLRRDNWICRGCEAQPATQAHHLSYPRNCRPGSDQWIAQEKLFHLVAICTDCHNDLHP